MLLQQFLYGRVINIIIEMIRKGYLQYNFLYIYLCFIMIIYTICYISSIQAYYIYNRVGRLFCVVILIYAKNLLIGLITFIYISYMYSLYNHSSINPMCVFNRQTNIKSPYRREILYVAKLNQQIQKIGESSFNSPAVSISDGGN